MKVYNFFSLCFVFLSTAIFAQDSLSIDGVYELQNTPANTQTSVDSKVYQDTLSVENKVTERYIENEIEHRQKMQQYTTSNSTEGSGKRWVCKITCTGIWWAKGPKGTLETFASDYNTAYKQAKERGAEELCAGSKGDGIFKDTSTHGVPDADCKEVN